jgi:hypothetical protein
VSIWAYGLASRSHDLSKAEPKFEITFEKAIPPDPISSQQANPFIIFRPSGNMYNRTPGAKNKGEEYRIIIKNGGKACSPHTFIEIIVDEPFSIAAIAVYIPKVGWFDHRHWRVQGPEGPHYREATLAITRIIGIQQELQIYPALVYARSSREKYGNQEKIEDALKVTVHSSVQKIEPSVTKAFPLKF